MKKKFLSLILAGALLSPVNVFGNEKLVDELYQKNPDNILVSDLSINIALSMLAEGASGETLEEIERYLNENAKISRTELQELLIHYHSLENVILNLANGVWSDPEAALHEEFVRNLSELYDSSAETVDFTNPETANIINDWCSEHTEGLIPEIVDADTLSRMDVLLANALYFKANWMDEFVDSTDETFTNLDQTQTEVQMMRHEEDVYLENEVATGFMKEYGEGMYYVGILPKEEGDFTLEELNFTELVDSASRDYKVDIGIPKYTVEYNASLAEILPELGLKKIFQEDADFDKMTDSSVSVSDILHKTYMKVDEEGTEAAAVTSVMIAKAMSPMEEMEIKEVILNRPFAYGIYDAENNIWIFQGKTVKL